MGPWGLEPTYNQSAINLPLLCCPIALTTRKVFWTTRSSRQPAHLRRPNPAWLPMHMATDNWTLYDNKPPAHPLSLPSTRFSVKTPLHWMGHYCFLGGFVCFKEKSVQCSHKHSCTQTGHLHTAHYVMNAQYLEASSTCATLLCLSREGCTCLPWQTVIHTNNLLILHNTHVIVIFSVTPDDITTVSIIRWRQ